MNQNVFNQAPYLRVQRNFPTNDIKELCLQLDKGYIDTASAVNLRTIGIFTVRRLAITGNSYYLTGTNQITFNIDNQNVNLIAGVTAPTIVKALIILEWIVQP